MYCTNSITPNVYIQGNSDVVSSYSICQLFFLNDVGHVLRIFVIVTPFS